MYLRKISLLFIITIISLVGCNNKELTVSVGTPIIAPDDTDLLYVHYIQVGQGDATYINYQDYDILIDGGDEEAGQIVVDYLKAYDVDTIELLIATHPDADHIGGLDEVFDAFDVESVIDSGVTYSTKAYQNYWNSVLEEPYVTYQEDADLIIEITDSMYFEIIETGDNNGSNNNNSVVSRLVFGEIEYLFTGDIDKDIEIKLLDDLVKTDVLKVAHHGSSSSTSETFIKTLSPSYAIISCGIDNTYGHPHSETIETLEKHQVQVYRTDLQGHIISSTDGKTLSFYTSKELPTTEENSQATEPLIDTLIIQDILLDKDTVILKNNSTEIINLKGYTIVSVQGQQRFTFTDDYFLPPNETISIYAKGGSGDIKWSDSYIWNNSGDPGELYDPNGILISTWPREE